MGNISQKKQALAEQVVRESVYQAVLCVLSEYGLERLTMKEVARAAGIATGTLYNYFKDKDALLVYAAEELFEQLYELQLAVKEKRLKARRKLEEFILTSFMFFNQNIVYFQFLDQAQVYYKMDISIKRNRVKKEIIVIGQIIEQGIADGVFKKVNTRTTADFFHRAIVGSLCVRPELGDFVPEKEARSLAKMFMMILE